MKFGTLLELNSNIEWWNHYVDYDALKKLFPDNPLDPAYHATQQESASLLPTHQSRASDKYASPEEFRAALDREKKKVADFYTSKIDELRRNYRLVLGEVSALEDREIGGGGGEDTIKEENEDEDEDEDGDGYGSGRNRGGLGDEERGETDGLLGAGLGGHNGTGTGIGPGPRSSPRRPSTRKRASIFGRLPGWGSRRKSLMLASGGTGNAHEADLIEASIPPTLRTARSRSLSQSNTRSVSGADEISNAPMTSPGLSRIGARRNRRSSDLDSGDEGLMLSERPAGAGHERRTSTSSASSHERDIFYPRRRAQALGLVEMDPSEVPEFPTPNTTEDQADAGRLEDGLDEDDAEDRPVYVWTGTNDHAAVMRIGFKKRISAVWLEAYALRQYVELNLTAFEKILKKYDKNTNSKLKKDYVANEVLKSRPWVEADKTSLDSLLARILFLYRRVATNGDEDLAKDQLRSQLREKVVVDRETVWSQMVSGHRGQGIFRSVEADLPVGDKRSVVRTPFGRFRVPAWYSAKGLIFTLACAALVNIVLVQPFERIEESNCLAMLVFCTILWATEAIPLFVTSLAVPLLVVLLRVLRSGDTADRRLSAAEGTKYIFSQMFSPTIMLLIGGFTIAAVLSKTRLDVMTATRILNAAGTRPSVVLLVLMGVATFASMWISNVAAPTLCYALIKPITNELPPKSVFSRALIIAIALAANIGGQASPISSPQNLIALGAMDPPLSWLQWFAISIPVSSLSVIVIWAFLHINYRWEKDLRIPKMRKNTDTLTTQHYYVLVVSVATIGLWCFEKNLEGWVGDMGVIAILPLLAFFGTGILSKEDFHSFHWSIVFLAMGGIALGKATLSSGLLDDLDYVLERLVQGLGLYSILAIFSALALVIATFISHTIAAVLLVPIATRIGESLDEPHPRLLIMVTALICSAGMGLPVSGFPNMTAITQENKLGQRFIGATDFLKNGIPASILATFVIATVGYAIMRTIGL